MNSFLSSENPLESGKRVKIYSVGNFVARKKSDHRICNPRTDAKIIINTRRELASSKVSIGKPRVIVHEVPNARVEV